MAKLNFTGGGVSRKLKGTPSKYRQSPGRPNISQSDGIRPAFPLMPYKGMNGWGFQDVTTEDQVVIPKGRIVSAITANSTLGSGDTYYGVGKGVMGLITPCNGGADRDISGKYTDEASCEAAGGVWDGSCTLVLSANAPIGVAEHDVYENIGGASLNYDGRNKNWGVVAHQLIKVPAVDVNAWATFADAVAKDGDFADVGDVTAVGPSYLACELKYSFYTYDGNVTTEGQAGNLLKSDAYGNYMEAGATVNNQVVGRLMGVDFRFNKDLLDTVQSKWEDNAAYKTAGTGTMGVPQFLYDFAYAAIDGGDGAWVTGEDPAVTIKAMVDAGVFGEAWILINI